jgi:hypothetical protein
LEVARFSRSFTKSVLGCKEYPRTDKLDEVPKRGITQGHPSQRAISKYSNPRSVH